MSSSVPSRSRNSAQSGAISGRLDAM
jgi:hypothetical protein